MKKYNLFIDNNFEKSISKEIISVVNPATDEIIGEVPNCSEEDTEKAIASSKKALPEWQRMTSIERAGYLKALAYELDKNKELFASLICAEQGKTLPEGHGEVEFSCNVLSYQAEWAAKIEGGLSSGDLKNQNLFMYKAPMGVVASIVPWNYPIAILARKLGPALITGNTMVVKPSSDTPLASFEFGKLIQKVGLPKGVVNIVSGRGSHIGKMMCNHPDISMITLTGSTEAGQAAMAAASRNLTKVTLELGGKAPAVIMNDADIDNAVACVLAGKIQNAGQVCTSTERVYVHKKVADEFITKITRRMSEVVCGNGVVKPYPQMGSIINHRAVEAIHQKVVDAVKDGAEVMTGGRIMEGKGSFYEPTVLINCRQEMKIMRQEIFGPVLPIMMFEDTQEALAYANDCEYGLTSILFTKSLDVAMLFSNNIQSGELFINRCQGEAAHGYHAGWKKSGIGGDDGKHGMEEFLQTRLVYLQY